MSALAVGVAWLLLISYNNIVEVDVHRIPGWLGLCVHKFATPSMDNLFVGFATAALSTPAALHCMLHCTLIICIIFPVVSGLGGIGWDVYVCHVYGGEASAHTRACGVDHYQYFFYSSHHTGDMPPAAPAVDGVDAALPLQEPAAVPLGAPAAAQVRVV